MSPARRRRDYRGHDSGRHPKKNTRPRKARLNRTAELDSPAAPGDNARVDAMSQDSGESRYAAFRHKHRQTVRA
jgi:hypothetical protein